MSPTGKGGEKDVDGRFARDAIAACSWVTYVTPLVEIATANGRPPRDTGAAPRSGCPTPTGGDAVAGLVHEFTSPAVAVTECWSGAVAPLHAIPSPHSAARGSVAERAIGDCPVPVAMCASLSVESQYHASKAYESVVMALGASGLTFCCIHATGGGRGWSYDVVRSFNCSTSRCSARTSSRIPATISPTNPKPKRAIPEITRTMMRSRRGRNPTWGGPNRSHSATTPTRK